MVAAAIRAVRHVSAARIAKMDNARNYFRKAGGPAVAQCVRMRSRGFKDSAGQWSRAVARLATVIATVLVAACQPNRSDTLGACQLDADRFYRTASASVLESPRTKYVIGCMAAHGYRFDFLLKQCDSSRPLTAQPACYSSLNSSWFSQLLHSD